MIFGPPLPHRHHLLIRWLLAGCLTLATLAGAAGCAPAQQTETASFEAAEDRYREAEYQSALTLYQHFLRRYPTSPLAEVARLRIRSIHREVHGILGRNDMPRPRYRATGRDAAAVPPPAPAPHGAP